MKKILTVLIIVASCFFILSCEDIGQQPNPISYCTYDVYQEGVLIADTCQYCRESYNNYDIFYENTGVTCTPSY